MFVIICFYVLNFCAFWGFCLKAKEIIIRSTPMAVNAKPYCIITCEGPLRNCDALCSV